MMRRKIYGIIWCVVMLGIACAVSSCGPDVSQIAELISGTETEEAKSTTETESTTEVATENTTEETTVVDDDAVWDAFLGEKKYLDYLNTDYDGDAACENDYKEEKDVSSFAGGFSYARCDINADGIDELIVDGRQDENSGFGEEWVYVIDADSSVKEAYHIYGYGMLEYSPKYEALVGMPVFKPFQGANSIPFYRLNGLELEYSFALNLDGEQWSYYDGDTSKDITESEKEKYISDSVSLNLKSFDIAAETVTENTTEASSETDTPESGGSDTGSGYSGTNHADMDISEFDLDALCEAYWIDFGQVGTIYKFEPDGKVYTYDELGIIAIVEGSEYASDDWDDAEEYTYTFDGSSLSIDMGCGTVDFSMHAVTDIQEGVQDGEPGTGNVYFYQYGYDRDDPYESQPIVLGEVDMSDESVSKAVNWIENQ